MLTLEDLARRHQLLLQDPVIAVQGCQQRLQPKDDLREGEHLPPQRGLTLDTSPGMATSLKPEVSGKGKEIGEINIQWYTDTPVYT